MHQRTGFVLATMLLGASLRSDCYTPVNQRTLHHIDACLWMQQPHMVKFVASTVTFCRALYYALCNQHSHLATHCVASTHTLLYIVLPAHSLCYAHASSCRHMRTTKARSSGTAGMNPFQMLQRWLQPSR
jgi:hypothetical protein